MLVSPYRNKVVIPDPIERFSTKHVLIMEYLHGERLAQATENRLVDILKGDRELAKSIITMKREGK